MRAMVHTEGGRHRWMAVTRKMTVAQDKGHERLMCTSCVRLTAGLVLMSSYFRAAPLAPDGSPKLSVGAIPMELHNQVIASNNVRFISVAYEPDSAGMQVAHVEASNSTPALVGYFYKLILSVLLTL